MLPVVILKHMDDLPMLVRQVGDALGAFNVIDPLRAPFFEAGDETVFVDLKILSLEFNLCRRKFLLLKTSRISRKYRRPSIRIGSAIQRNMMPIPAICQSGSDHRVCPAPIPHRVDMGIASQGALIAHSIPPCNDSVPLGESKDEWPSLFPIHQPRIVELMALERLSFGEKRVLADTLENSVSVPLGFHFHHNVVWENSSHGVASLPTGNGTTKKHQSTAFGINRQPLLDLSLERFPEQSVHGQGLQVGLRKSNPDVESVEFRKSPLFEARYFHHLCTHLFQHFDVFGVVELKGGIANDADQGS